ncbi:hypothetical protein N7492_003658 [Penicillium capsulatum]|uniref:Uncharacterized protein n=1 Tax=Penicillium capsulatum TaxID=69766 RepID=A0A9W9IJU0_9EURO|nr:hypothetical protein N7492_003658 [Penicillium capsulatum]KAJ6121761.1 hypothetical protein N7512_004226 [Penicillium capsulatum]
MPIKLPKSFGRRKSSGNILEDVDVNQQPSFRVFERPGPQRSMTDGAPLTKRMSEGNAVPSILDDNIFAGTEQHLAKGRYERPRTMDSLGKRLTRHRHSGGTYESSTSTRLSSSSTLPSSTEIPPPDETLSPHSRIQDIPVPPPLSGALRAAGRTFSFGGRFKTSTPPAPPRHADPDALSRQRAQAGRTDATTTPLTVPPKLPDSGLGIGASSDDFGKMFDHLDIRGGTASRDPSPQRPQEYSSTPAQNDNRAARPVPINIDRSTPVDPSPYSWDSRHSEEGLLHDPDASPPQSNPSTVTGFRRASPAPSQTLGAATTTHRALDRRRQSDLGLRRSGIYAPSPEDSFPVDDEDARLVRQSLLWSGSSPPGWTDGVSPTETPLVDKGKAPLRNLNSEPEESIFAYHRSPAPPDSIDPSIADNARLAVQFAESVPRTASPGNKVMTPSQFEHYRQQQELRRSKSDASKSEDEYVNDEYDDEDEAEKQRETERQRRKQEAHLSVYRQQMMKVTGQQATVPSLRPVASEASNSSPNLPKRLSNQGDKSLSGKSSEEDDEEVPLGILAAHGFPNRNRPPTRLGNVSSNPNLRSTAQAYASSANSVTGAENENRNSLPVFARNLPRDPYFGASLVNPPNRESLAMGGGSVYGGRSSPAPTGGLINVIANEERARAMRRGSPNTQAMQQQMGGVPRPYSMMGHQAQPLPSPSATEQAQINLSHQMSQMMQMQMEWMQSMFQMQGMTPPPMNGGVPSPPVMRGGAVPPGAPIGAPAMQGVPMAGPPSATGGRMNLRPSSMPSAAGNPSSYENRTLSMIDPNIAMRRTGSPMPNLTEGPSRPNTSYAPSIAPSERSNMGLASRYRPVSVMQGEPGAGHYVSSPSSMPWGDENQPTHLSPAQAHAQMPKSSTLATVTVRPVSRASQAGMGTRQPQARSDDEDDDEAWADMAKKREKKKSTWKSKRETSSFGDLLGAVH